MSRRTRGRNRYQSQLSALLAAGAGVTTATVDSSAGLDDPCYLVIDHNDPTKVEFIRVETIAGSALSGITRNLAGSVGAVEHAAGALIKSVPVHQWLDDIFDDIEDLETDTTNLAAADAAHFGGTDTADHPEATTSVRGFLSSTDKTKLNALDTTKQVTGGDNHDHAGGDGAQIAHSGLSGLTSGDPHTQYLKEKASGGTAAETPEHDHSGSAQGGLISVSGATVLAAWPVGSIFISTVATNPNTLLGGGTWVAFAAGRVLVGLNAGDTDFDTAEETGGSKLIVDHTHSVNVGLTQVTGEVELSNVVSEPSSSFDALAFASNLQVDPAAVESAAVTGTNPEQLMPYIVVYMWKRTA